MTLAILVLFLVLLLLLAYKGLICRRQRHRMVVAMKLQRQNGGLYLNCPDEAAPEINAVTNYLAKDGGTNGQTASNGAVPNGGAVLHPHHSSLATKDVAKSRNVAIDSPTSVAPTASKNLSPCPHCHKTNESASFLVSDQSPVSTPFAGQSEAERLTLEREKGPSDTMDIRPAQTKKKGAPSAAAEGAVEVIERALAHTGAIPKRRSTTNRLCSASPSTAPPMGAGHHQQLITNLAREQKMARDCRECQHKNPRTNEPQSHCIAESKTGATVVTRIQRGDTAVAVDAKSQVEQKPLVRVHSIRNRVERASMKRRNV